MQMIQHNILNGKIIKSFRVLDGLVAWSHDYLSIRKYIIKVVSLIL